MEEMKRCIMKCKDLYEITLGGSHMKTFVNANQFVKRAVVWMLLVSMLVAPLYTLAEEITPLAIISQPQSYTVPVGTRVAPTVKAQGDGLTYAWYYKDPGKASFVKSAKAIDNYTTTMTEALDGRQLYCVVGDAYGNTVQSNTVTLKVYKFAILTQPENVEAAVGEKIEPTVKVQGSGLKYAWYYKDPTGTKFVKSAKAGNKYDTTMSAALNGRQLYCVITDSYGTTLQTNTITISLKSTGPKITKQPQSVTLKVGERINVTVEAQGTGLTYTWYYKDPSGTKFLKSSQAKNTYSTPMTAALNGRQLYCVVKDSSGNTVQSNTVTITLNAELKITKQPQSVSLEVGERINVTVEAQGTGLTYTWYYKDPKGTSFLKSSQAKNTYSTPMTAALNGRQLYCVVKDANGNTVQSNTVTISLAYVELKITKQPQNVTLEVGERINVTVEAQGTGLTYAWYYKDPSGTKFLKSSQAKNTYSTPMTAALNGRQLYCIITDSKGKTVQTNTVTVSLPYVELKITKQPQDQVLEVGERVNVTVEAQGTGLTYTWYFKDVKGTSFLKSSLATKTYSTNMTAALDGRQLYCVVTDAKGKTVQTNTVTISIPFEALEIVTQPQSVEVEVGQRVNVTVEAKGTGITYTWYYKDLKGTKFLKSSLATKTYSTTMTDALDGRQLYCVLTDSKGNTLQTETVTVSLPYVELKITKDLEPVIVAVGTKFYATVEAEGVGLTYTWYYKDLTGTKFLKSSQATKSYTTTMTAALDGRQVYCEVADKYGNTLTSATVYVCLPAPAGVNTTVADGKVTVTGYTGTATALVIPQIFNGYPVVAVAESAFLNNTTLTSISLPASVTAIGASAFKGCTALKAIDVPAGVTEINADTFNGCSAMESAVLPNAITRIGARAFANCTSLSSMTTK